MKTIRVFMAALLLTATIMTCKKDNAGNEKKMQGTYLGKWGHPGGPLHNFFKLQLKPGGELVCLDEEGDVKAFGTYTVDGIRFEGNYTHTSNGEKHTVAGLYANENGVITGTWGFGSSRINGGVFELKQLAGPSFDRLSNRLYSR